MCKIAFFWDESFLWGLIAYDTFRELGVSFDLLTSKEIHENGLDGFDVLFVPGGWASDKITELRDVGREKIRTYVRDGGSYLGICGGAGLALSHETGLALVPVSRMSTKVRLPSFSGGIALEPVDAEHPMWRGFPDGAVFHAWWPGQFALEDADDVEVLAIYDEPAPGSFVTDLPVLPDMHWEYWERSYGINLQPERIIGEPAVIETSFGAGKVLLSYLHFETPDDVTGHEVLLNILEYLAGGKPVTTPAAKDGGKTGSTDITEAMTLANSLKDSVDGLISFGTKNFLWYQRNDWILQWRRGVRGVEYSTLNAMLGRLADTVTALGDVGEVTVDKLRRLREIAQPFFEDAPRLLLLERDAMGEGPISPLKTGDEQILALRRKLFSESKRCGGLFKEIIDLADEILLPLLREELRRDRR
ncbi:MAG: hypothetical protein JJD96_06360 [Thermoleophilia bacterium]|nr:hypothetical protein [Thermoleophilia bacterium]